MTLDAKKRWPTDQDLVRDCRKGDAAAWDALVERYQRLVYSVPVNFRIPAADADDIFQRVMVKLFDNLGRLRKGSSLAAWLVVTTRRECVDLLRGNRRLSSFDEEGSAEPADQPEDIGTGLDAVEREHLLGLALARLDPRCGELLRALYIEEPTPSYEELSRRLRRPIGSLGPTRSRCLAKLRRFFLDMGGTEP